MRLTLLTFCITLSAASAHASDVATSLFATELGNVLASEAQCGLNYDQASIEALIDDRVDPAALGFASTLTVMVQGSEAQIMMLSASAKTAHCRAVENTARHYGFIE